MIKICGITNREDALAAVHAGARALGFVFYPPSPRSITPDQLAPWVDDIPADIWKVGVFVNESPVAIERIAARLRLDIAQLHGNETPAEHPQSLRVWKAFRATDPKAAFPDYPAAEAILIDGAAYDWTRTQRFTRPVILAGGLNPENVRDRIAAAKPWGVDVASGIETSPGRKDHARMKNFMQAVLRS
ncbi:MAG: phosphoribosylanthranilate isomerase [Acidobacteriota bacterium]|nr:phosphoribosylanthranilate isomerase [Acidobacteriota bacterium]